MTNHDAPRTEADRKAAVLRHKSNPDNRINTHRSGVWRRLTMGCAMPLICLLIAAIGMISLGMIMSLSKADHSQIVISDAPLIVPLLDFGGPISKTPTKPEGGVAGTMDVGHSCTDACRLGYFPPDGTGDFSYFPETDIPPLSNWEAMAIRWGVGDDHVVAVRAVVETTGVAGAFLLAVGKLESHNQHYTPGGAVKRGDGGRAIGWGQVHRSPWQKWAAGELDREIDLDVLEDNVLVAAMILQRGGYDAADEATWEPAAAYYNTGKHLKSTSYSRAVMKQYAMIKDGE